MELLTVKEVANWLKLKPKTVYQWAASGKLPVIRLGSLIRFDSSDIAKLLASRKEN